MTLTNPRQSAENILDLNAVIYNQRHPPTQHFPDYHHHHLDLRTEMSPYSSGYPVHDLLVASPCSSTTPLHTPPYDVRGRQQQFVETAQQRKARLEFLKKREWARRVAEWIRETSARQDVVCCTHCEFS